MDILKKAVLLVAILSISVFMAGCGGEEEAEETGSLGLEKIDALTEGQDSEEQTGSSALGEIDAPAEEQGSAEQTGSSALGAVDTEALKKNIEKALAEKKLE